MTDVNISIAYCHRHHLHWGHIPTTFFSRFYFVPFYGSDIGYCYDWADQHALVLSTVDVIFAVSRSEEREG